jgi:hypothetical protein
MPESEQTQFQVNNQLRDMTPELEAALLDPDVEFEGGYRGVYAAVIQAACGLAILKNEQKISYDQYRMRLIGVYSLGHALFAQQENFNPSEPNSLFDYLKGRQLEALQYIEDQHYPSSITAQEAW